VSLLSFIAGGSIAANDAVYVDSNGFLHKASAESFEKATVTGIAIDTGVAGSLIRVNPDGFTTTLSGLTPDNLHYVAISSGDLLNYPAWVSELSSSSLEGAFLTSVGMAISSSGLNVEISRPIFVSASGL
jgi:hypothetical protein